jgi:hypothetical protein
LAVTESKKTIHHSSISGQRKSKDTDDYTEENSPEEEISEMSAEPTPSERISAEIFVK